MRVHCSKAAVPITALLALLLASCSGGPTPTTPTSGGSTLAPAPAIAPSIPSDVGLLGALTVRVDPATLTATADPMRLPTAYGDNYWLNATGFLDGAPCKDCFSVTGVSRDIDGNVVLSVNARHPFAAGNPALPISGVNRLDLHVFDAAVLVAADLDNETAAFLNGSATVPARLVRNAAGYSPLLTSVVQSLNPALAATAFPYVMLNEDRTAGNFAGSNPTGFADLEAPTGMNVFPMGADVTSDVVLGVDAADGPVELTLLFTCAYGASVNNRTERLNPRYCLPEFNTKPAWKVEVEIPAVSNTLQEGQPSSSATVNVRVWDWQQGATVDPLLDNFTSIRGASDVASVSLLIPGLRSTVLDLGSPISGTGPFDDPLTYSTIVTNAENALEGDYIAVVEVVDSRSSGLNAGGATDGLSSIKGTTIDPVSIGRFVTYQTAELSVATGVTRQLLSIDLTPNTRQIIDQGAGGAITFTAMGNYDMPPLTEDVSATAVFSSSAIDCMSFVANVGTGIGMGKTQITCAIGAITSNSCEVIVKPAFSFDIPLGNITHVDVNQTTNEIYLAQGGSKNIYVYNPAGTQLRTWAVSSVDVPGAIRTLTVDESTNQVVVSADSVTVGINSVLFDSVGTRITAYNRTYGCSQNAFEYLANGTLWGADFCSSPFQMVNYNTTTGATISGFNNSFLSACYDMENVGDLLYVSTPGGRYANRAWTIINPATQALIGGGGGVPTGGSQNCGITVDRDGFIHVSWTFSFSPLVQHQILVYEFIAPSTVNLLYEYSAGPTFVADTLGVEYDSNDVWVSHVIPGGQVTVMK